jgi:hypothetical protein
MIAACLPTQLPAAGFTCGMRDNVSDSRTTLLLVLQNFSNSTLQSSPTLL